MKTNILIPRLENCARCHHTHENLTAFPFTEDMPPTMALGTLFIFTHWAPCPTNAEPILIAQDTFKKVHSDQFPEYIKDLFPTE